jgi:hypothetical protein
VEESLNEYEIEKRHVQQPKEKSTTQKVRQAETLPRIRSDIQGD